MESSPSLLSAGLAVLSALLYLLAVWRQVLNLEAGAEHQRQQIAMVGAAALAAHALRLDVSALATCTPAAATRNTLQRRARRPCAVCRDASVVQMGRATAAAVPRRSRLAGVSRPGMIATLRRLQAVTDFPPVLRDASFGCPCFAEKWLHRSEVNLLCSHHGRGRNWGRRAGEGGERRGRPACDAFADDGRGGINSGRAASG